MKKLGLKFFVALALLLFVSLFVGCAKTGEGDIFRFEVRELELTVGNTRNLKLVLGEQEDDAEICFVVSEVGSDPFDQPVNQGIISLEKDTIKVGETLKVTAVKEGEAYLTAYIKGNKNVNDTIVVTVNKEKLTALTAVPTKDVLKVTETASFAVTTYPNTISQAVTYESSDTNVGTISDEGVFTAVTVGTTQITITSVYDPSMVVVKTMTVVYDDTTDITIAEAAVTLDYQTEYQINATALPNEYPHQANPNLVYISSDETIVSVSETGLVKGLKVGEATVTVKSADGLVEKNVVFTVKYADATAIAVLNGEEALENDGTINTDTDTKKITLKISITPDNAEQVYTCVSDNEEVITVTDKGVITVVGAGTAKVTITSGELTFVINVNVVAPVGE